jgi:hypothetical protein
MVAGRLVFKTGTLLTAERLVVALTVLLAELMPGFVAGLSVELLEVFWLQPANANAAMNMMAGSVMVDFIICHFMFVTAVDLAH